MKTKEIALMLVISLAMASGMTYAIESLRLVNRITINKPAPSLSVSVTGSPLFSIEWAPGSSLDPNQNVTGVTKLNAEAFQGNRVNVIGYMVNAGSTDVSVTWSAVNVPKGLTLGVSHEGAPWSTATSLKVPRGTRIDLTIVCLDDGTLAVGPSTFDIVVTAQ